MSTRLTPLALHVLRGRHRGARVTLEQGAQVLGSDDRCDIVLVDAGVAPEHLLINMEQDFVTVSALAARVTIDARPLILGRTVPIGGHHVLRIADCILAVTSSDTELAEIEASLGRPATVAPRRELSTFVLSVAGLVLTVGLALSATSKTRPEASELRAVESAQSVLATLGLHEVVLKPEPNGNASLEGIVPSQTSYHTLRRRLAHLDLKFRLFVADEIVRFAGELMNERGFETSIHYAGAGAIVVDGPDADAPGFEAAALSLQEHVPGVRSVRALVRAAPIIAPTPPPVVAAAAPAPLRREQFAVLRGVNGINAGHVVPYFSNGKHYVFAGGTLKNGMTVRRIQTERVTLHDPSGPAPMAASVP